MALTFVRYAIVLLLAVGHAECACVGSGVNAAGVCAEVVHQSSHDRCDSCSSTPSHERQCCPGEAVAPSDPHMSAEADAVSTPGSAADLLSPWTGERSSVYVPPVGKLFAPGGMPRLRSPPMMVS